MIQPRLVISGLSGGSGKTLLSLSLARVFSRLGLAVQPCKKGPDYIDAAWLGLAAGRPPANLDPYFLDPGPLRAQFARACLRADAAYADAPYADAAARHGSPLCADGARACDLALIEGNRGLYDGRDVSGHCSTVQLAQILDAPVILALNCAKMTRTAAALVLGVRHFDPGLKLAGVIINNTGSARHAALVRQAIEQYCDVPVLGALPRLRDNPLPERHMGLAWQHGSAKMEAVLERLADYVSLHADLDAILACARAAPPLPPLAPLSPVSADAPAPHTGAALSLAPVSRSGADSGACSGAASARRADGHRADPSLPRPVIGYVRDDALWFYYQENLDALRQAGADLVRLSILDPAPWPTLDGLYLGGGFPELYGQAIADSPHRDDIRALSLKKRPIYAECGGLLLLCASMETGGKIHPMSGLLHLHARFDPRPQGLGYVEATTVHPNPFHPVGSVWRGHEFHYTRCEKTSAAFPLPHILSLKPGAGMTGQTDGDGGLDGLCVRQTFACYTHLYAPAVPHWAPHFVAAARR